VLYCEQMQCKILDCGLLIKTHLPSGNHQICAELLQLVPNPHLLRPKVQQFPTTHTALSITYYHRLHQIQVALFFCKFNHSIKLNQ